MGTQVEESHNSVGMHVTWPMHVTLTSLLLGMSGTTGHGHLPCGLGTSLAVTGGASGTAVLACLPGSAVHRNRHCPRKAQLRGRLTGIWKCGRGFFHLCEQTPVVPHISCSAAWKAQLMLLVELVTFGSKPWSQRFAGCPRLWWPLHARTQGRTHGQQPRQAGLGGPSPSRTAPSPQAQPRGAPRAQPGTHAASRESKMTWNTNGFVPFQTKLLFWYYKPFFFIHKSRLWYKH